MAISQVIRLASREGEADENGVRTYSVDYLVISTSPAELESVVGSAPGLPGIGTLHLADPTARCNKLKLKQRGGQETSHWDVTASYTNELMSPDAVADVTNDTPTNPLKEPAKVSVRSTKHEVVFTKDILGHGVVNSAGDYFDPPPMKEDGAWSIHISKNYGDIPANILTYRHKVNFGSITIGGIPLLNGQAKISEIVISPEISNGMKFIRVEYTIDCKEEFWEQKLLDQGFREKFPSAPTGRRRITEPGTGEYTANPVLLDGAGAILANPSPTNAKYMGYQPYEFISFAPLDLPTTIWGN